MPRGQIDNPLGAFGYPGGLNSTGAQPNGQGPYAPIIRVFRNASTAVVIPRGAAVAWSTLSTLGGEVAVSTVIGNPLFCGISLTSAGLNTERTSVSTAAGLGEPGSDLVEVLVEGPYYGALLTSGTVNGDLVWMSNSTVAGAASGGYLAPVGTTAAGNYAVAGVAHSSGTTGTTGFLTTAGPRGVVWVNRSIVAAISTA